jgi:dipeptidyl aminopeptidase/acylaminoacyl peptidase
MREYMARLLFSVVTLSACFVATVGFGGCRDEPDSSVTTKSAPTLDSPASDATTTLRSPAGRAFRFRATDGKQLRGTLTPGRRRRSPAVVLVHQLDGGPEQWEDFIPYLYQAGYASFAYRSRSVGTLQEALLARDIGGAVRALGRRPEIDPRRLAVVGASIGATATAWFAGTPAGRQVSAFVALSPTDFHIRPRRYQPHDLLLMADYAEIQGARSIGRLADNGATVKTTPAPGHGVALLPDADVRTEVLDWLASRVG